MGDHTQNRQVTSSQVVVRHGVQASLASGIDSPTSKVYALVKAGRQAGRQ